MRKRGVYDVKGWVGCGAVRAREREREGEVVGRGGGGRGSGRVGWMRGDEAGRAVDFLSSVQSPRASSLM